MQRPAFSETAPYYCTYIDLVAETDAVAALAAQTEASAALYAGFGEAGGDHRYAPGKWSVKELLGHVIDAERVFANRAFHFARGDQNPLPGMEQDDYIPLAEFGRRKLADLLDEYRAVRAASLALFRTFDERAMDRRGIASGNSFTVRGLVFIVVGHDRHHAQVLRERYR